MTTLLIEAQILNLFLMTRERKKNKNNNNIINYLTKKKKESPIICEKHRK